MPTVIMLDEPVHTDDHPYCADVTCPCHAELQAAWAELQAVPSYVERDLSAEEE